MLYTTNFAFIGLHEAAAAGDDLAAGGEEKLAKFLCRIQVRSEAQPSLDGGWFRAFDFRRWEPWGSNADPGWGAWAIESGWTQSWITSVLGLRQMKTSLWDLTRQSKIAGQFDALRKEMLPDDALAVIAVSRAADAPAQDAAAALQRQISLTLIPPSPVTDKIILEIRAAVWNEAGAPTKLDVALDLDAEKVENPLHFEKIICYQYLGLMTAPDASIKPGGEPPVKLCLNYRKYLEGMSK